jgi:hypothetical protein
MAKPYKSLGIANKDPAKLPLLFYFLKEETRTFELGKDALHGVKSDPPALVLVRDDRGVRAVHPCLNVRDAVARVPAPT